ncbi:MAG: EF-P lysine aminoacylase GenX [Planctomycetaceae bacterium]|nr:EF-P lysine aminoacylase GenX [Planctomycetaceae bacterium]
MNDLRSDPALLPTASLRVLRFRAEMLDWVRQFFRGRGYWEVETPLLSHDVCVDVWLEPFAVEVNSNGHPSQMFLQTSPEFGMKRLVAAGAEAIFQVTRAFRQEESGPLHNPEFTIVEWYRVGETYHQQMDLVERLVTGFSQYAAHLSTEMEGLNFRNCVVSSLVCPFPRITYEEAFRQVTGKSVMGMSAIELSDLAESFGIRGPESLRQDDRDGWLNLILTEVVEPRLEEQSAVFVYDYPSSQAALARISEADPAVAERFELYLNGIEICNGYQELTDVNELRRRQSEHSRRRQQEGLPALPEDNRLVSALELGLPECSGVALGFDRLLLSALQMDTLSEVVAFPFDRA